MNKFFYLFAAVLFFLGCNSKEVIVDDDFRNDLGRENYRIAADLYLDEFNNSLDSLTYDFYLTYLNSHEVSSTKGLTDKIKKADGHFFRAKNKAFLLVLDYGKEKCMIGDISSTTIQDTVYWYKADEIIPSVKEFASKLKY